MMVQQDQRDQQVHKAQQDLAVLQVPKVLRDLPSPDPNLILLPVQIKQHFHHQVDIQMVMI